MVNRRPNYRQRLIALLATVAAFAVVLGCGGPPRPPKFPTFERVAVNQRAIGIPYGAVVLLRIDEQLVALRIVDAPLWGYAIEYEWNEGPADAAVFETTATGAGQTDEKRQRGRVLTGSLLMQWSRGSEDFGWLYWPEDSSGVSVSSITFRSVDSIHLQDPEIFWYRQEMFK